MIRGNSTNPISGGIKPKYQGSNKGSKYGTCKKAEIDCWEYRGTMGMFATGVTVVALKQTMELLG
jgi:hypothetical protein